jgi:predicted transcriptional regulator
MTKIKTDKKVMKTVKLPAELVAVIDKKAAKEKRTAHYLMVECLLKGFK